MRQLADLRGPRWHHGRDACGQGPAGNSEGWLRRSRPSPEAEVLFGALHRLVSATSRVEAAGGRVSNLGDGARAGLRRAARGSPGCLDTGGAGNMLAGADLEACCRGEKSVIRALRETAH